MLEFTQRKYRAEGSADPVTVRRVAVELGIGCQVQVQTQDGKKVIGRIAKVDVEQLNLSLGGGGPMNVSFAQISELKPKGSTVGLWTLVGLGVAVVVVLAIDAAVGET